MTDFQGNPAAGRRLDLGDFVSAAFDAHPAAAKSANKLVVICTTPRTAGNTLCRHMTVNGWGIPTEYFLPDVAIPLFSRWSGCRVRTIGDVLLRNEEYGNHLLAKRSANGVFSLKLFPHQWQQFMGALAPHAALMDRHCILLQREDLIEQTLSILATMVTRRPSFSGLELRGLTKVDEVSEDLVRRTFQWLVEKEKQWPHHIANFGGSLNHVKSEDLINDPAGALLALADELGLSLNQVATRRSIELEQDGAYQTNRHVKDEIRLRFSKLLADLRLAAQRP